MHLVLVEPERGAEFTRRAHVVARWIGVVRRGPCRAGHYRDHRCHASSQGSCLGGLRGGRGGRSTQAVVAGQAGRATARGLPPPAGHRSGGWKSLRSRLRGATLRHRGALDGKPASSPGEAATISLGPTLSVVSAPAGCSQGAKLRELTSCPDEVGNLVRVAFRHSHATPQSTVTTDENSAARRHSVGIQFSLAISREPGE